ncbi:MAG: hypothetical protein Q7R95_02165 [bacterium]|nr:hypothetical protein [bacterium]
MAFSINSIAQNAPQSIQIRSRNYVGRVNITHSQPNRIDAIVYGTYPYHTSIIKQSENEYIDECDCPYGVTCKHTIALSYRIIMDKNLIRILDNNHEINQNIPSTTTDLIKILDKIETIHTKQNTFQTQQIKQQDQNGIYYRFVLKREYVYSLFDDASYPSLEIEVGKYMIKPSTNELVLRKNKTLTDIMDEPRYIAQIDYSIMKILSYSLHKSHQYLYHDETIPIHNDVIDELFMLLSQSKVVLWKDNTQLNIAEKKSVFTIECIQKDTMYSWQPVLTYQDKKFQLDKKDLTLFESTPVIAKYKNTLYRLQNTTRIQLLQPLLNTNDFTKKSFQNIDVINKMLLVSQYTPIQLPTPLTEQVKIGEPVPLIILVRDTLPWKMEIYLTYDDNRFPLYTTTPLLFADNTSGQIGKRNIQKEQELNKKIKTIFNVPDQLASIDIYSNNHESIINTITNKNSTRMENRP